jgi:hypothetical protein
LVAAGGCSPEGIDFRRWLRSLRPRSLLLRWCALALIGGGVSSVWWVLMQAHASVHEPLLYRHLSVCFVLWTIFLAVQLAAPIERWQFKLKN